jgi:hypothetical protein
MTRAAPKPLACAFQSARSIAIVLGVMVVSALVGWRIGRA